MGTVTVGILVPDADAGAALRSQVRNTGLGMIAVEVTDYPRAKTDLSVRKFVEAHPDVILIAAEHPAVAEESVRTLRAALPAAWILVCTSVTDERIKQELLRLGVYQVIPSPVTTESLTHALRHVQMLQEVLEARERERKGETHSKGELYAICAGKRGAGATTVAINVAMSLAELPNSKVALVDMDWPIGDVAAYLNVGPRYTISEALAASAEDRLDAVLLENYMYKYEQIQILAGLEEFEAKKKVSVEALQQLLDLMMQNYTHTVVDLSLSLDPQLIAAVTKNSGAVLAVITPELPSLRRAERLLRFVGAPEGSVEKIRFVLNRVSKHDDITDRDIQKTLKHPVTWKVSNDYRLCKEAINAGKTVLSNKYLGREFREMARQLAGVEQAETQRRGLFSLLPKTSSTS